MTCSIPAAVACLSLAVSSVLVATPLGVEAANSRFRADDFKGAAEANEQLLKDSGPDATVYYNLGNSYQQLKQYGPAILAYERARLITPRDPDLLANLGQARKAAAAFEDGAGTRRLAVALAFLSRNEWSWLVAGAALFLGALAMVCGAFRIPKLGIRRAALASAVTAVMVMGAGVIALYFRRGEAAAGIVISENATVRLSPFDGADAVGTPGPGRLVTMGEKTGGYHYVEIPGSNLRGWMAAGDISSIVPSLASQ